MNTDDRSNLNFLLNASEPVLMAWFNQATEDDIAYAQELLNLMEIDLLIQEYTDLGFAVVDIPTVPLQ